MSQFKHPHSEMKAKGGFLLSLPARIAIACFGVLLMDLMVNLLLAGFGDIDDQQDFTMA